MRKDYQRFVELSNKGARELGFADDIRIKTCIEPTAEDFTTIHHEFGHNFYQRAYKDLPVLFRDSANDGFQEAIAHTIAPSVTQEDLVTIRLLDKAPDTSRDNRSISGAGRCSAARPRRPTTTRRGGT